MKIGVCAIMALALCSDGFLTDYTFTKPLGWLNEIIAATSQHQSSEEPLLVRRCKEFTIDGKGSHQEWNKTEWSVLSKIDEGGRNYESKFKVLASSTGIYLLFYGEDDKITTKAYENFGKIWNGDVFEVFFHPNPKETVYYEYEVNQFGKQLVLTISNSNDQGLGWVPFNEYGESSYGIKNKVAIVGGLKKLDSSITSWSAEVFLSYKSLGLLPNVPPQRGTIWNANFCRLDHDTGNMVKWSWTPTIERSLHELDKFRSIKFE